MSYLGEHVDNVKDLRSLAKENSIAMYGKKEEVSARIARAMAIRKQKVPFLERQGSRSNDGHAATTSPEKKRFREPNFTTDEFARLCHCLKDSEVRDQFNQVIEGPGCRGKIELGMVNPWKKIHRLFNDEDFRPSPPKSILETSEAYHLNPRQKPKIRSMTMLEKQYRAIRAVLTIVMSNYKRSGQHDSTIEHFTNNVKVMYLF